MAQSSLYPKRTRRPGINTMIQKLNDTNEKIAAWLTRRIGTMWCAYAFSLMVLPGFRECHNLHDWIQYFSTAYLQLVMLPLIMVGTSVLSKASEKRSQEDHVAVMESHQSILDELTEIKQMHDDIKILIVSKG